MTTDMAFPPNWAGFRFPFAIAATALMAVSTPLDAGQGAFSVAYATVGNWDTSETVYEDKDSGFAQAVIAKSHAFAQAQVDGTTVRVAAEVSASGTPSGFAFALGGAGTATCWHIGSETLVGGTVVYARIGLTYQGTLAASLDPLDASSAENFTAAWAHSYFTASSTVGEIEHEGHVETGTGLSSTGWLIMEPEGDWSVEYLPDPGVYEFTLEKSLWLPVMVGGEFDVWLNLEAGAAVQGDLGGLSTAESDFLHSGTFVLEGASDVPEGTPLGGITFRQLGVPIPEAATYSPVFLGLAVVAGGLFRRRGSSRV